MVNETEQVKLMEYTVIKTREFCFIVVGAFKGCLPFGVDCFQLCPMELEHLGNYIGPYVAVQGSA